MNDVNETHQHRGTLGTQRGCWQQFLNSSTELFQWGLNKYFREEIKNLWKYDLETSLQDVYFKMMKYFVKGIP